MSFEKVEAVITAEAEVEAKHILDKAREEKGNILAQSSDNCLMVFEDDIRRAKAAEDAETSRQTGQARHEGRLAVLHAKNAVIDEVFTMAAEKIRSLPPKDYMEMMAVWLKAFPAEVGGTLRVSPSDAELFSGAFLEKINVARSGKGKITAVESDRRVDGGFIMEGVDFSVDSTIASKLKELRESLSGEIARELFGS
ncbi:MAG: V-type ATP synthase subunit E [Candidatus Latescibacterota bacterium]